MKKIISMLLVIFICVSAAACGAAGNPGDDPAGSGSAEPRLVSEGKLTVLTDVSFPPYEMDAEDGQGVAGSGYTGIDLEIAAAIADRLGLELEIQNMDCEAAVQSVRNGKGDLVIAGLYKSPDLEKYMLLSEPYAEVVQVVIVPEGSEIRKMSDLKDEKVSVADQTTAWIYAMENYDEKQIRVCDSFSAAVDALLSGKVEAAIMDEAPAKALVRAHDGLTILKDEYSKQDYYIAVAPDNPGLQQAVNQALQALEKDGTIRSILDRYIPVGAP